MSKHIIDSKNLAKAIEYASTVFELTDDDINKINEIIIDTFKDEWHFHPQAKKAKIKNTRGSWVFESIVDVLPWSYEKKKALESYVNELMLSNGYIVYGERNHLEGWLRIKIVK